MCVGLNGIANIIDIKLDDAMQPYGVKKIKFHRLMNGLPRRDVNDRFPPITGIGVRAYRQFGDSLLNPLITEIYGG
jgi:hypothetical protein